MADSSRLPLISHAEHGEGLGDAVSVLRNNAMAAGLDAPVPTCPGWRVRDLVVHLGMVQRWATAILTGTAAEEASAATAGSAAQAAAVPDLLDWLDEGLVDLLNALATAPEDLSVFFFLSNTASASRGWARRQCHEAVVHAVDAMAARTGRAPTAAQTWITPRLATDGVDELLRAFLPRRSCLLRSAEPFALAVTARDTGRSWLVRVGPDRPVTERVEAEPADADVVVRGDAVGLYLALWNRGDEVTVTTIHGREGFLGRWRELVQVHWG